MRDPRLLVATYPEETYITDLCRSWIQGHPHTNVHQPTTLLTYSYSLVQYTYSWLQTWSRPTKVGKEFHSILSVQVSTMTGRGLYLLGTERSIQLFVPRSVIAGIYKWVDRKVWKHTERYTDSCRCWYYDVRLSTSPNFRSRLYYVMSQLYFWGRGDFSFSTLLVLM